MHVDKKEGVFASLVLFRAGGVLCNASAGLHRWRKHSPVPMRLPR
jgi:hypothetical protein